MLSGGVYCHRNSLRRRRADCPDASSAGPDMRRRTFVVGLGVVAAWRRCAFAEQTRTIPRLGILLSNSPQTDPIAPMIEGLRAAGYIDGETLLIEYRYA